MIQNTIHRIVLCGVLGLCSLSVGYAQDSYILEGYTPVVPCRVEAASEETSYRTYQSVIYTPFTTETPSSASASSASTHSGPRRLGGETVDPGRPPGKGSPVGDPVLPLLLAALLSVGAVCLRQRKKKTLNDKIN